MLAQTKVDDKYNEIKVFPKLLYMIDIKDSVINIDAMGCQQSIVKKIVKKVADYLFSLKDNQKTLHTDVKSIFEHAEENKQQQYKNILHSRKIEKIKNHDQVETRKYTIISAKDPLLFELRWPGLQGIEKIDITRTTNHQVEYSTRYFITSLYYENINTFMRAVRKH